MKKRLVSILLATLMLIGLVPISAFTVSAATAPDGGIEFSKNVLYSMDKNLTVSNNMTIEAEFWMPNNSTTYIPTAQVTLLSNFGDNGINAGNAAYRVDITDKGYVQFYTRSYNSYVFDKELICKYMYDSNGNPTFVKIAIVADVDDYTDSNENSYTGKFTLYINGEEKQTVSATKTGIKPGVFSTSAPLCIGGDYRIGTKESEVNSRWFRGKMKNITIYSGIRTDLAESAAATDYSAYINTNFASDANLKAAFDFTKENYITNLNRSDNDLYTRPTTGMSFTKDTLYAMQKNLEMNGSVTIEATVWIPEFEYTKDENIDKTNYGVIIGNYGDHGVNPNPPGEKAYRIDIVGGCVQLYSRRFSNSIIFQGEKIKHTTASGITYERYEHDIRNYMTPESPYVHISLVIDVEDIMDEATNQIKHTGKLSLYINGSKVSEITSNESHLKGLAFSTVEPLCVGGDWRIGTNEAGVNSRYFKGMLKNITVYSDIRTDEEISDSGTATSYANSLDKTDKNLMVAYDFTKKPFSANLKGDDNYLLMYTRNGMTFEAGKDALQMAKVLPVESLPHTFETTLFLPDYITEAGGVIIGNLASTETNGVLSLEIKENGNPGLAYTGTDGSKLEFVFDKVNVLTNNWVHLVVVHEGTALKCYVDGKIAQEISTNVTDYSSTGLSLPLCIGGDWRKNNEMAFKGTIKDIAIYSTAKTEAEVSAMYKNGVDTAASGIVAYYDLREAAGKSSVDDTSVNAKWNAEKLWLSSRQYDPNDYAYTFAVVGDTQKLVFKDFNNANDTIPENDSAHMAKIYDWIVANKDAEKIKYVFGLGDIVEYNYNIGEWDIAYENISKLSAAGIPYSLVRGNHDKVYRLDDYFAKEENFTNSDIVYYEMNEYLGVGSLGNYYQRFEVGGTKYMVMCLDWGAVDSVLEWASEEIEKNPDCRVIITTHCYLYRDGTTLDDTDEVPPSSEDPTFNDGDDMWNELMSKHRNILLVLSGHDGVEDIIWRQDRGEEGNMVSQFLIDPQTFDVQQNYQTGMVALFHFSADGRNVAVEWYSTVRDMYYRTENQFEFKLIDNFGNGIYKTEFIKSEGLVDTYRIYYTNGTYEDFTVTNGAQGQPGQNGTNGSNGETPFIGTNGNWWIGTTDTGIKAQGEQGIQGEAGAKGDKGDQGEQGIQGEKGDKGDTGAPGASGSTPYIGVNGNWYVEGIDTGIKAQGDKGETGATGPQGPQGEKGEQGPQGIPGTTGAQGEKGDTGSQGIPGSTGAIGEKGDTDTVVVLGIAAAVCGAGTIAMAVVCIIFAKKKKLI